MCRFLRKKKAKAVPMKRIILHWSAGNGTVSDLEKQHYHRIVDHEGKVHQGHHPVSDNIPPLTTGNYAAHTRMLNSYSIGVAMSAMRHAREAPFSWGDSPMTEVQVDALCLTVSALCTQYGIEVTPSTVLTHAEVQGTLGVRQNAKWDITILPGMELPQSPRKVGDILRSKINSNL